MITGKWELVIVWANGDKDVYIYRNESEAKKGMDSMKMALGGQISWAGVREQVQK